MFVTKTRREDETTLLPWDDGPCGFDAGDANLRRIVGNDPTNATDPSGLAAAKTKFEPLDVKNQDSRRETPGLTDSETKVGELNKVYDKAKYGGGEVNLGGGSVGQVRIATGGVTTLYKFKGKPGTRSHKNAVIIGYTGPASAPGASSVQIVQLGWLEATYKVGDKVNQYTEKYSMVNAQKRTVNLSTDPMAPSWFVDAPTAGKDIDYLGGGGAGAASDQGVLIADSPAIVATIADEIFKKLGNEKATVTVTDHFVDLIVYKHKPVYAVAWQASATSPAATKEPVKPENPDDLIAWLDKVGEWLDSRISYTLDPGSCPDPVLNKGELDAIKSETGQTTINIGN